MRRRPLAGTLVAVLLLGGCSAGSGTGEGAAGPGGDGGDGHGAVPTMAPPGLPPEPGAIVDLRGFHEGRMRLTEPTSVRHEPDDGLLELNFVSDDDGQLFLRVRDPAGDEPTAVTVAFEVPLHVSPPNKRARRYQSRGEECLLTLATPLEVGSEVAGTFVCSHVSGERGSLEDLAGSFRTGITLPASGREESRARDAAA